MSARWLRIESCHQCKHITRGFMDVSRCELTGSILFSWREPNPPPPIPDDCKLEKAPVADEDAALVVGVALLERLRDD